MSTEETKTTYLVKGTSIREGGKTYKIGRRIQLNDEDATRLKAFLETIDTAAADDADKAYTAFEEAMNAAGIKIDELRASVDTLTIERDQFKQAAEEATLVIVDLKSKSDQDKASIDTLNKESEKLTSQIAKLKEALAKKEGGKK